MKTNEKSFQKRLLIGKENASKGPGKFIIFCLLFSTVLSVSNPVFASTTKDLQINNLGESDTNPEPATLTLNLILSDPPTVTPEEPAATATGMPFTETPSSTETSEPSTPTISPTMIVEMPTSTLTETVAPTTADTTATPVEPTPTITATIEPTHGLLTAAGLTQYYVSTSGSNSNPGNQSQPWKTIQHAVDTVNPGDTVYIMGGTYNESVKVQRSGTSDNPIKLTNYNNQVVTISGGTNPALIPYKLLPKYWIIEGLRFKSTGRYTIYYDSWGSDGKCKGIDHWTFLNNYISGAVQICGAYTIFEGNEVDGTQNNGNGGNGVHDMYEVSHHNIFRNNHVHNFSNRGIWSMNRTHDDLFEGNLIHDIPRLYCIDTDGFGSVEWRHTIRNNHLYNCGIGIYLENTFASVVENNLIHNITNLGIGILNYGPHITGSSYPTKCTVGGENNQYGDTNGDNSCEGDITNNIVRQNLVYNHGSEGGIISYHAGGIKLLGNTIIGSSGSKWGVRLSSNVYCPNITLQSNIITGHSDAEIILEDYASLIVDNQNLIYNNNSTRIYKTKVGTGNWYLISLTQYQAATGKGQGSVQGDPKFVNAASEDFHLLAGSPAIDRGVDIGLPYDLNGNPRPQGLGYDIGVYESPYSQQPTPTKTSLPTKTSTPVLPTPTRTKTPVLPTATPISTPLHAPNLLAPVNYEGLLTLRPTFEWEAVSGATSYSFQLSTSAVFSSFTSKLKVLTSTYSVTSDLALNKIYYWRVRANGASGSSAWSEVRVLLTPNTPTTPSLSSPAANALLVDLTPRFNWSTSRLPSGTVFDHYQLQVAKDKGFTNLAVDRNITGKTNSEYTLLAELLTNTKYYWRVRAFNTLGQFSSWSSVRYFREAMRPPALITPVNGASLMTLRPAFDWSDVAGASSYTIQISRYKSMFFPSVKTNVTASNYVPTKNLTKNKTLYWRVRANGTNGPSEWSVMHEFLIALP